MPCWLRLRSANGELRSANGELRTARSLSGAETILLTYWLRLRSANGELRTANGEFPQTTISTLIQ
ncbi:MAG: hypothetical protein H7329_12300 [Opitutaceae bacterium]|nr:hypothetical protein [Cytophagales bacterium]